LKILVLIISLLAFPVALQAETEKEIKKETKTQRLVAGLTGKAKTGSVRAQTMLADIYLQGKGVIKDPAKAAYWMEMAAKQGDVTAQFNIAMMYGRGDGVTANSETAFQWFLKAAEQKDIAAQYKVALHYRDGIGAVKNTVAAKQWLQAVLNVSANGAESDRAKAIREQVQALAKKDLAAL
jgi:uncharacterized protein